MYPQADIPVIEMSLDYSPCNGWHRPSLHFCDLAKQLGPLREEGIMVIGSGNIVQSLSVAEIENLEATPHEWAVGFD
jgi:4,5-DOPA dioxygenase extradiol